MTRHLFAIFAVVVAMSGCNEHLAGSGNDNNLNNNDPVGVAEAEALTKKKVAMWVEYDDNTYDYRLTRERQPGDLELVGFRFPLETVSAFIVTGEDFLLIEVDDLVELYEVPAEEIGRFEMLIRDAWGLPVGWQPNLFPDSETQALDMEYLLSAFICAKELPLHSRGCVFVPESLLRKIQDTAFYQWNNPGHAKYVFGIYR